MSVTACIVSIGAVELLFYVILRLRSRIWQAPLSFHRGDFPKSARTAEAILQKFEKHLSRSRQDAESLFMGWYFDAPMATIRRCDAEEFLAWAVFSRRRADLAAEELKLISDCLSRVEARVGLTWGTEKAAALGHRHSSQRFAGLTWETDCKHHHFPLIAYFSIFCINRLIGAPCLLLMGFRYRRQGPVGYWLRENKSRCGRRARADQQEALVFFHGICIGLVSYLQFLIRFRHQTVILVELHWVTFSPFCTKVPEANAFCDAVADLLDANGISSICPTSHSYGSFMISWLLFSPRFTGRINRVVLVSAPSLCLFLSKTCRTVIYDRPHWFEYTLAHVFFRQFFWYQCVLTAEDLPKGSIVVLMERDELIPVSDVVRDCEDHGVRCCVVPRLQHGFELFYPLVCGRVVQFIRQAWVDDGRMERMEAAAKAVHSRELSITQLTEQAASLRAKLRTLEMQIDEEKELLEKARGDLEARKGSKDDANIKLFFHTARSSELYNGLVMFTLNILDGIASRFFMRGHSPYNLHVLAYLDDLWQGRRDKQD